MIRVLYVVKNLPPVGPVNQLFYMIDALDRNRYDPIVLTLSTEGAESARSRFSQAGVRLEGLVGRPSRILRQTVYQIRPDIVQTYGSRADSYSAYFLRGFYRITTIREIPYEATRLNYGFVLGSLISMVQMRALRTLDKVAAVSKQIGQALFRFGIAAQVIYNGTDMNRYHPVDDLEKLQLRGTLGLPADKKIVISSGLLSERKDPLTAIGGYLNSRIGSTAALVLLGDGPLMSASRERAGGASNIFFKGAVKDVDLYLKASDAFLSASRSEGLPNAVMEAMACGLPCVLSDIEPHRELLQLGEPCGLLFKTGEAGDLSKKLDALFDGNLSGFSEQAFAIARERLDSKIMAAAYQKIYEEAAASRNKGRTGK